MSGIVGLFSTPGSVPDTILRAVLEGVGARGGESVGTWREGPAALGVSRFAWETAPGLAGPAEVADEPELAVAADASLYYRDDLRRSLAAAGVPIRGDTAAHLIAAAYRAWGERCAEQLEGDFAFVLWDKRARRAFCARDFGGKRPLLYARAADAWVVASTIGAVLAHPGCPRELNLAAVAADAAGLFASEAETVYGAVSVLPGGYSLILAGGEARAWRHWMPPPARERSTVPFAAAAEELRALLIAAARERMPASGTPGVWLSGGWDSTAVFGTGEQGLRERGDGSHLRAVSLSFPPGDPGREDELIQSVVDHWGSPVRWIEIDEIPVLAEPQLRAAARDEPFAHAFEMPNRALAAGTRAAGSRVAWDGVGGDQLFQVSNVYLADLLRTGRWRSLAREWKAKGLTGSGARTFFRWAVQPNLPPPLLSAAALLRGGRPLLGHLERPFPTWMKADFVRAHALVERDRIHTPPLRGGSRAAYETHWYLTHPYFPRVFGVVADLALREGVELRSPLYDRRVIEFALSRPRNERAEGPETKRLLRHAVRGLLPDSLLAPRTVRTGVSGGYLDRSLRSRHAELIEHTLAAPLRLAELGMVDADALRRGWRHYRQRGGGALGVNVFFALQAELWLRARLGNDSGTHMRDAAAQASLNLSTSAAHP